MKKLLLTFITIGLFGTTSSVFAETQAWNFDIPANYTLSSATDLNITTSLGQLTEVLSPTLIGNYDTTGTSFEITISSDENTIYVADYSSGLSIIDISTPATPSLIVDFNTPGSARDVKVSSDGNTAYIADESLGLQIIDISTPATPSIIGNYDPTGFVRGVVLSSDGNTAYIAASNLGLQIIDISIPAIPSLIGTYDTPSSANKVTISSDGNTAYIADASSGLQIIDISTPATPSLIGTYDTPNFASNLAISSDGNTAYVADQSSGLQIIDITTPATPSLIGVYDTPGSAYDVTISSDGNTAYIADHSSGLQIIDISTPITPSFIATYDTAGVALGMARMSSDGNTAYIADASSGLQIIDVRLTASYSADSPHITPTTSETFTTSVKSFTETLGTNNAGTTNYQVSTDNGTTWNYWDGAAWATTVLVDGTETNTATEINTNIATLDTDGGDFLWRAYLTSDGNQDIELDAISITFDDIIPPSTPLTPNLQSGSDTGLTNSDNKTSNNTPVFDTQCTENDSTITLYANAVAVGTHTCTAVGPVSVTVSPAIADDTYDFTLTETDLVGNESTASAALEVVIDTTIDLTTINTPTTGVPVSGTADANSTVTITTPSGATCTTTTNATGTYSCTLAPIPIDTENITAQATDIYGNTASNTETAGIDTNAPITPTITPVSANDTTITGTGEDGTTITLDIGTCTNAPVIVAAGVWSCDIDASDAPKKGDAINATTTDAAGNYSTAKYRIPNPKKSGSSKNYTCKDETANNYSRFGTHKQSKCEFDTDVTSTPIVTPTEANPFGGELCSSELTITNNMKNGDTNGVYSSYNQGVVTEVSILQAHINRLLADEYTQAAGPVDKWFRSKTKLGVERIQTKLNQLLQGKITPLDVDGVVGPYTKAAINMSC
ncbi:Ig-like domain-containing protein [Polaribacter sp. MSW13]|uniref:Ig-like domain-containing protein n=1 Tax=Polaribacter marinus TaxID=2916838 RepID=A0A9X1VRV4_9FLAO|nr:Ig-like domain-containing protein [Polaribacter marinus]MCI2229927.1 Ig-like domain-containing protein [Polaribacter marinus]